ncbi:hypothetical protein [Megalodesulfovibrio paquesii]
METAYSRNRFPTGPQAGEDISARLRRLRVWQLEHGVTWADMGRQMTGVTGRPVSGSAVYQAVSRVRMPIANWQALREAYPSLPKELLPVPEDVPLGRPPKSATPPAAPSAATASPSPTAPPSPKALPSPKTSSPPSSPPEA